MIYFSLFLTIASLVVHFSTYIGIYLLNEYYLIFTISYIIHGLIFIPFLTMIFKVNFGKNKIEKINILESFNPVIIFKRFFPNTNYKIGIIIIVVLIYVVINFYFSIINLTDGIPEIIDGKYIINNNGEFNEINKKQFVEICYLRLKAFSGHWIIFSIIPLIYFMDKKRFRNE